jgi:hypothetical protein
MSLINCRECGKDFSIMSKVCDGCSTPVDSVTLNEYIIGKPYKLRNIEVAEHDFPNTMKWEDAIKACEELGEGWHLPTKEELNLLYLNKDKIGGFTDQEYWNSIVNKNYNSLACFKYFSDGGWNYYSKETGIFYVRAVRSLKLKSEKSETNTFEDIIGQPIKIDDLEVAEQDFADTMKWNDAIKACKELGEGWHLPTKEELNLLYLNKDKIGGFETYGYWSSSENSKKTAWIQSFSVGYDFAEGIHKTFSVRAVRSLILKNEKVIPK